MTKQPPQKSDVVDYERCPVFRKHFSILVSNPESDDLVLTVHDAKMREKERPRPLGKVKVCKIFVELKNMQIGTFFTAFGWFFKVVISDLLGKPEMESPCQPWKLNTRHKSVESDIVISLKLVFLKPQNY